MADYLGLSIRTTYNMRHMKTLLPEQTKLGRLPRWEPAAVRAWALYREELTA